MSRSPDAPRPQKHDPYAAFRVPAYRDYLFASLLVQIGVAGQEVAIGWEVYQRTKDPFSLALVGLATALPMLLLTLPAGVLADRFDRRKVILFGMAGTTLTSVALALLSAESAHVGWMYLTLFLDSVFLRIAWPARATVVPMIVPRDLFENAVKWRMSGSQVAGMVGPAVGGFLVAWSLPGAYGVAAASTAVMMLVIARLDVDLRPPPADAAKAGRGLRGVVADLGEGLAFVYRRKLLLGAISLDLFAVLFGGATFLLPIFATDILHVGATGLGWLRAAPAAGALVTALTLAYLPPMRRAGWTLLVAVAGFGVVTVIFGLSTSFWLSMAMLALTGVFDNVSVVVRHTLVQLATPEYMRGRVSAVSAVFIGSSNELGGVESGTVAALTTPVISVVSGGLGTIAVVLAWAGLFPQLRDLKTLGDADDLKLAEAESADRDLEAADDAMAAANGETPANVAGA